jgi:feruloyl esterase
MKIVHAGLLAVALAALALGPTATVTAQTSCEALSSLSLPNATITLAQSVPAGNLSLSAGGREQAFNLPAFCRVAATLTPTMDSDIRMEVWLPTSNWNGKFQVNDGEALNYRGMVPALRGGYATGATDAGRTAALADGLFGHPEKVADFAYRGVHEMTIKAKAIIQAFYGRAPVSYWYGCSASGGQGLMEAHRFPGDYDGIIAGAPGSPLSHGYAAWRLWRASATLKNPSSAIPPGKYAVIHEAVLRACDASDGLKDGLIDNPRRCNFDPGVLVCQDADTPACLTVAQVETVRRLLNPVINPRTGRLIYPPVEPGSELGWAGVAAGGQPPPSAVNAFKYVFLKDPNWDWHTLDLDRDIALVDNVIEAENTNTLEPDIRAFADRGGKLLLYQGWSDTTNAPQSTINYYINVQNIMGTVATSNSVRLFMAPGMGHCGGGEGPNTFDVAQTGGTSAVMEQWVESGKAPDRIIASHIPRNADGTDGKVDRTRPLCPYPQVARYNGTGSIDAAANFECKMP